MEKIRGIPIENYRVVPEKYFGSLKKKILLNPEPPYDILNVAIFDLFVLYFIIFHLHCTPGYGLYNMSNVEWFGWLFVFCPVENLSLN